MVAVVGTFEGLQAELTGFPKVDGITGTDILLLPEALRGILKKMLRQVLSTTDLADALKLSPDEAQQLADILVDKGVLQTQGRADGGGFVYKIYFARTQRHDIPFDL